jgi:hypothetical protein
MQAVDLPRPAVVTHDKQQVLCDNKPSALAMIQRYELHNGRLQANPYGGIITVADVQPIIEALERERDGLRVALRGLLGAVDEADQDHPLDRPAVGAGKEAKAARAALLA